MYKSCSICSSIYCYFWHMNHSFLLWVFYAGLMLSLVFKPSLALHGQNADASSIFEESVQLFEEKQFRAALDGFSLLKKSQPANVLNYYYLGRCLVELNEDLDEAIELLYSASRRSAPDDALYYLAKAYHRDYNFSEAMKNYQGFKQIATRQELKDLRVNHMIASCRSALEITATYNQYEVMAVTLLDLSDSVSYSQIRMKGGQMQVKSSKYFKLGEDRSGLGSLMFMPASPQRGDYIYYAGPGRNEKTGMQLFRSRKGSGRSWGDPEEVKALNTEGDELLPYYDPIEHDLYFSSNGGSGIGGFDLYRAHFDPERDKWTEAINLGFPINSAMDDYLLLPGSDLGMMMFFSNRQGTDSTLTVYRVHMVEPKLKTDANDTRKLKQIANLDGAADELLAEIVALSVETAGNAEEPEEIKNNNAGVQASTVYTEVTIIPDEREYLSEALLHQATSDSLKDLAGEARVKVRESEDPNDRWVWQKQIMVWEKNAHDEEVMADALYARMEDGKTVTASASPVNSPESVALLVVQGEPGSQPESRSVSAGGNGQEINRFDILSASPYSESNPIPSGVALPAGVFYRIQLGAYGSAVGPDTFGGISPITAEVLAERGLIKYYAGKFTKYEDASLALSRVRSRAYEDAFVSAWYNGSPISTQKAKQLE